eukprot:291414-Prorocentrum_minimum.AAC.2
MSSVNPGCTTSATPSDARSARRVPSSYSTEKYTWPTCGKQSPLRRENNPANTPTNTPAARGPPTPGGGGARGGR